MIECRECGNLFDENNVPEEAAEDYLCQICFDNSEVVVEMERFEDGSVVANLSE